MKRREFLKAASSAALLSGAARSWAFAKVPEGLASHRVWCWAGTSAWMEGFLHGHKAGPVPPSFTCPPVEWVDFFHCRNVNYQPIDVNYQASPDRFTPDKFKVLGKYDQVSVHLSWKSDRHVLAELSQSSLECPNITGGYFDDFSSSVKLNLVTVEGMRQFVWALKSANPYLKLSAVCYTMHLDLDLSPYLPFFDSVTLWVWHQNDIRNLDAYVAAANRLYKKPLSLGIYLIPYADLRGDRSSPHFWEDTMNSAVMPMDLLEFQCKRARQYLQDGRIEAIQILGSYARGELKTKQARWLADFCLTV